MFGGRPVSLVGNGRIIDDRKNLISHLPGCDLARSTGNGPVDQSVDPLLVEPCDPKTKCPVIDTAVAQNQWIGSADEQQMHGIQSSKRPVIGPAIHRLPRLFERAGIRVRKLMRTSGSPVNTISNSRTSLLFESRIIFLAIGLQETHENAPHTTGFPERSTRVAGAFVRSETVAGL